MKNSYDKMKILILLVTAIFLFSPHAHAGCEGMDVPSVGHKTAAEEEMEARDRARLKEMQDEMDKQHRENIGSDRDKDMPAHR